MTKLDYYGTEMNERRERFNRIIRGMDMVLMNNIPEVDPSVWENWEDESPLATEACEWRINDATEKAWCCDTHMFDGTGDYPATGEHPEQCAFAESDFAEVYQWFAIGGNDAEYLKDHNQYITYSDMLDTYFLAITHCGTSWDYVDSMVNDILGDAPEFDYTSR
jgi:hypothetical protein